MPIGSNKFDPEGDGYDYETAEKYGMGPDESGHWQSREPKTGLLLKGKKHETWHLLEDGERQSGYKIIKKNGRYYSFPVSEGVEMPINMKQSGFHGGGQQSAAMTGSGGGGTDYLSIMNDMIQRLGPQADGMAAGQKQVQGYTEALQSAPGIAMDVAKKADSIINPTVESGITPNAVNSKGEAFHGWAGKTGDHPGAAPAAPAMAPQQAKADPASAYGADHPLGWLQRTSGV